MYQMSTVCFHNSKYFTNTGFLTISHTQFVTHTPSHYPCVSHPFPMLYKPLNLLIAAAFSSINHCCANLGLLSWRQGLWLKSPATPHYHKQHTFPSEVAVNKK